MTFDIFLGFLPNPFHINNRICFIFFEDLNLISSDPEQKFFKRKRSKFICFTLNKLEQQIILFSHGNGTDMGLIINQALELSFRLEVHVFIYEYPGFGQASPCKRADMDFLSAINLSYNFIINQLEFEERQIIVYGYSFGSGPSIYLASTQSVGGLVLHCPFYSFSSFVTNELSVIHNEPLPNGELIKAVKVPTFVIHASNDQVIPSEHGKQLSLLAGCLYEYWSAIGANHQNIDQQEEYFFKLEGFLKYLSKHVYESFLLDWELINHVYKKQLILRRKSDMELSKQQIS